MTVFAGLEDADCGAGATGTAGTADTVDVGLVRGGDTEVDHMREVFKVDTAGGHVSGDNRFDLTGAGALHHTVAGRLIETAVKGFNTVAAGAQCLGELINLHTGTGKDDGEFRGFNVENATQRSRAVVAPDDIGDLRHAGCFPFGSGFTCNADANRVGEVCFGNGGDLRGQRGRKERRLNLVGKRFENGVKLIGKTQIEHLIGFVKHNRLNVRKVERAAADMVKRTPRGGDDDMSAALECTDLTAVVLTAVNRGDEYLGVLAVVVERFAHLQAEFAGRRQNENNGFVCLHVERIAFNERKGKRGGFTCTGCGFAENVPARKNGRDRFVLNGGGLFKTQLGESGNNVRGKPQICKGCHLCPRESVRATYPTTQQRSQRKGQTAQQKIRVSGVHGTHGEAASQG